MASLNPCFENLVDSGASVKADCQFHLYGYNILTNSLIVNRLAQYFCKNFFRNLYKKDQIWPFGAFYERAANSAFNFSAFLIPGASSTPLETSISSGLNFDTKSATFSGLMPPASQRGISPAFSRTKQSFIHSKGQISRHSCLYSLWLSGCLCTCS